MLTGCFRRSSWDKRAQWTEDNTRFVEGDHLFLKSDVEHNISDNKTKSAAQLGYSTNHRENRILGENYEQERQTNTETKLGISSKSSSDQLDLDASASYGIDFSDVKTYTLGGASVSEGVSHELDASVDADLQQNIFKGKGLSSDVDYALTFSDAVRAQANGRSTLSSQEHRFLVGGDLDPNKRVASLGYENRTIENTADLSGNEEQNIVAYSGGVSGTQYVEAQVSPDGLEESEHQYEVGLDLGKSTENNKTTVTDSGSLTEKKK